MRDFSLFAKRRDTHAHKSVGANTNAYVYVNIYNGIRISIKRICAFSHTTVVGTEIIIIKERQIRCIARSCYRCTIVYMQKAMYFFLKISFLD